MAGLRRDLAELAAQLRSMRVAVDAMQRQLTECEALLLRLQAEHLQGDVDAGGAPPEQQGS